jgi:hypothetical protein
MGWRLATPREGAMDAASTPHHHTAPRPERRRALLGHLARIGTEAGEQRFAAAPGGERPGFGTRTGAT